MNEYLMKLFQQREQLKNDIQGCDDQRLKTYLQGRLDQIISDYNTAYQYLERNEI